MGRKKKQDVKINNQESLQGLMQEVYSDACLNIIEAQSTINELKASTPTNDLTVDDLTKIAKEKGGLLKVKDSAIRVKLEVAKLQTEIIKNGGNVEATMKAMGAGEKVTTNDIKDIIAKMKETKKIDEEEAE